MAAEEIKLTVTADTGSAVANLDKVSSSMDGVTTSTKQATTASAGLDKAMARSITVSQGFGAMKESIAGAARVFGGLIGNALAFEKNSGADGAGSLTASITEMKAALDDAIQALNPGLTNGLKAVANFIGNVLRAFSSLSPGMRTAIVVIVAVGVAIAVLTKIVIAFGISLNAAIWPITAVVLAITAIVAIIVVLRNNWELVTIYWQIGVEKIKRFMGMLWAAIKVGALYIAQFMIYAARIMYYPHIKAIDAVIWAWNKLTGSNIQSVSKMIDTAQEGLDEKIEIAKQDLANSNQISQEEIALSNRVQEIKEENRRKESEEENKALAQKKARLNENVRANTQAAKQTNNTWMNTFKAMQDAAKKRDEQEKKLLQQKWEATKSGYQESSQFVMNNLDKSSKNEFAIWKGLAIAQVMIDTYKAAMGAYAAFTILGPVGVGLGAAAAAAVTALGLRSAKNIASQKYQPKMATGGIIRGSSLGTSIIAGEGNRSEAIIPLENPEAMSKLGGMGGQTNNININIENMLGDPKDFPVKLAEKIDAALYNLHRKKASAFGSSLA